MKLVLFLAALALAGCSGCNHNPPPTPSYPPIGDASLDYVPPPAGEGATCLEVCRNGIHLGCPWSQPTPAGASCLDVCLGNQSANIAPWDLGCRARATSCAAVDACN